LGILLTYLVLFQRLESKIASLSLKSGILVKKKTKQKNQMLSPQDELLLTLFFLCHYSHEEVLGELFRVSEETVRRTFHKVIEILFTELKDEIRWPHR
jgi:hypothetical protein